jgi:hypothetical protein
MKHRLGSSHLPFMLIEEEINEDWEPIIGQEYMIEYSWKDKKTNFLIGRFSSVWFGYNFHWFWSGSSLQLSMNSKIGPNPDWKRFKRVWKFIRLDISCSCSSSSQSSTNKEEFLKDDDVEV